MQQKRELVLKKVHKKGKTSSESSLLLSFGEVDDGVTIGFGDSGPECSYKLDYEDVATALSFLKCYVNLYDEFGDFDEEDEDDD